MEIEPILQGDLDGLCGLYSIINALNFILPWEEYDEDQKNNIIDDLFKHGITWINKKYSLKNIILNGMTMNIKDGLIRSYEPYLLKKLNKRIITEPIALETGNIRGVWTQITEFLSSPERRAVLLSVQTKEGASHATSIIRKSKSEKTLYLCDSGSMEKITTANATTAEIFYGKKSIKITPENVIGISLLEDEEEEE